MNSCRNSVVKNNTINHNINHGISLNNESVSILLGNTINENGGNGILLVHPWYNPVFIIM